MRRRLALLLLPLALGLLLLRPRAASEHALHLHFPSPATLREAHLVFQRDSAVVRDLTLRFPEGAADDETRAIRLRPGAYEVGARLVYAGSAERHLARALVAGEGDLDLDFR